MAFGAHIQSNGEDAGTVSTRALAYTSNNTAGNILSAVIRVGVAAADQVTSITDTQGNTWAKRKSQVATADHDLEIWTAFNCAAGANTVTVNLTSATLRWIIQEHTGNGASTFFEKANGGTGSSTSALSNYVTTTRPNTILLGGASSAGDRSFTATGSFTKRVSIPADPLSRVVSQDRNVTATGTYGSSDTLDTTVVWAAIVVAINDGTVSGGGGGDFATCLTWANGSNQGSLSGSWTSAGFWTAWLTDPSESGNTIVVFITSNLAGLTGSSFTFTDDKGNTYTGVTGGSDTAHAQSCVAYYSIGVAAGTRKITIQNNSGGARQFTQVALGEFNNITAIDVTATGSGNGASATTGSLTPTQTGDLIVQYAMRSNIGVALDSYTSEIQNNIEFKLLSASLIDGNAVQYGNYAATAAITPAIGMTTATDFVSVALAFKTGAAGSLQPRGIYVRGILHENKRVLNASQTFQLPTYGNLLALSSITGALADHNRISGITDSNGNVWKSCGPNVENGSGSEIWYAEKFIGGPSLQVTVALTLGTSGTQDFTYLFYDIAAASDKPFDLAVSGTGNQLVAGPLTTYTIRPTEPGGLVLANVGVDNNTEKGPLNSPSPALFDAQTFDGELLNGPSLIDENNGWAHYYSPDTSPVTWTWSGVSPTQRNDFWAGYTAAFKSQLNTVQPAWPRWPSRLGR